MEDGTFSCLGYPEGTMSLETTTADDRTCAARDVLDRVGDKWSVVVVHQLGDSTKRFTELKRGIGGISQRMLTATLRGLERDGLVERTVYPVVPPRVDYSLTPLGRTLLGTVSTLFEWAVANSGAIEVARKAYDAHRDVAL